MSNKFERGIRAVIGRTSPRASPTGSAGPTLTLASPEGWLTGDSTESGAMKLSAVNRCQVLISESLGKMPVYCIDGNRQRVDHDLLRLLNIRPNEAMTPSVERQMVEGNRLSGGNGYEWIVRDPRSGRPVELIPIPWELVHPFKDSNGVVWYGVVHPDTGDPMVLSGQDVCHYKGYTHDGLTGISVLRRASEVITAGRAAQQYEANFFSNGSRPSGVLTVETDLSGDVEVKKPDGSKGTMTLKDYIRADWERVHSGPNNAHRIAILDHGLKYQPISVSNADAQFVESKALTVEDIARFYGVPLSKIYAGKQAYNSNEQNAIDYVVSTLHPIVTQYDQERTYKLLLDSEIARGLRLRANMMVELKGDFQSRSGWYKSMREIGAFSVNDILALEDLPAVDGGDERYASLNYVPLSLWRALSVKRNENGGNSNAGTT